MDDSIHRHSGIRGLSPAKIEETLPKPLQRQIDIVPSQFKTIPDTREESIREDEFLGTFHASSTKPAISSRILGEILLVIVFCVEKFLVTRYFSRDLAQTGLR